MSKHDLEVVETRVRSELPLEELLNARWAAGDVGERCVIGGVCLDPGVSTHGGCVGVQVGEDDWSQYQQIFRNWGGSDDPTGDGSVQGAVSGIKDGVCVDTRDKEVLDGDTSALDSLD